MKQKLMRAVRKPRYIFFLAAMLMLTAGYLVYLFSVGGTYTLAVAGGKSVDPASVRTSLSREGVVEVKDVSVGYNVLKEPFIAVEIVGVGVGDTELTVSYEIENYTEADRATTVNHLFVTPAGVIYDLTLDSFHGLRMLFVFIIAAMTVMFITLVLSFRERRRQGKFSYSIVAQGGAIIFLSVLILIDGGTLLLLGGFFDYICTRDILRAAAYGGEVFVFFTALPLLFVAVALAVSNIWLVRHEGFRPQNLLGVLLGAMVIGGGVIIIILEINSNTAPSVQNYLLEVVEVAFCYIFCYIECMFFSTIYCAAASTRYKINEPIDYLIILGCAIRGDGTPTPLLRGRVDRALTFEREQFQRTGRHAKFVPSGGQGSDEVISEAESMKRCLVEQGVPAEQIILEDRSVNTYQNMAFSKRVIEEDAGSLDGVGVAFSTTNYHVFRGYTLADRVGMTVKGLSAKTKLYFFPNAFVREFIGLLWEKRWRHLFFIALISVSMALIYTILQL